MRKLVIIGFLAALFGCVADVLLLYSPNGGYHTFDYDFLKELPSGRVLAGHYLGILAIPFELCGLWVLSRSFKTGQNWIFGLFVFVITIGVAYHGSIVWVKSHLDAGGDIELVRPFFEPLGNGMVGLFLFLSSFYLFLVAKQKTNLPKGFVVLNPIVIYLLLILFYVAIPPLGNILIVAGFNICILLQIGGLWWLARNESVDISFLPKK